MLSYAAISRLGLKNVAIITLEQLAPFPFDRVKEVRGKSCMLIFFVQCLVEVGFRVVLGVDAHELQCLWLVSSASRGTLVAQVRTS